MTAPRTEAGREAIDRLRDMPGYGDTSWSDRILAIEAEAATLDAALDFIAQAQHIRAEHDATHGEAEMCGAECIALGLAEFDSRSEEETGP